MKTRVDSTRRRLTTRILVLGGLIMVSTQHFPMEGRSLRLGRRAFVCTCWSHLLSTASFNHDVEGSWSSPQLLCEMCRAYGGHLQQTEAHCIDLLIQLRRRGPLKGITATPVQLHLRTLSRGSKQATTRANQCSCIAKEIGIKLYV